MSEDHLLGIEEQVHEFGQFFVSLGCVQVQNVGYGAGYVTVRGPVSDEASWFALVDAYLKIDHGYKVHVGTVYDTKTGKLEEHAFFQIRGLPTAALIDRSMRHLLRARTASLSRVGAIAAKPRRVPTTQVAAPGQAKKPATDRIARVTNPEDARRLPEFAAWKTEVPGDGGAVAGAVPMPKEGRRLSGEDYEGETGYARGPQVAPIDRNFRVVKKRKQ